MITLLLWHFYVICAKILKIKDFCVTFYLDFRLIQKNTIMKNNISLEELAMFILGIFLFSTLDFQWWWFVVLILLPDISMFGYAFGNKIGAYLYNFFHHKAVAIVVYLLGIYLGNSAVELIGIILFSHSAMDRMLGYGLKYTTSFTDTHLGKIKKS